jgi:NAD(P)-dependent dehydrogenase (short-subunit alcohol dehydrogenase family)
MKSLENKVAIVTGAGSGLGRAIATLFAAQGTKILAADVNEPNLQSLVKEISAKGDNVQIVKTNMAVSDDIETMVKTAVDNFGTIDILVNNAGIMDDFSPVADVTDALWDRVMKVNLEGPFKAMRSVLKIMLPKKSGVIVNIASVGGLYGARAGAVYTASKHALVGLTKNTGYMYAKLGIRCNAICPGAMNTNIGNTIDFAHLPALELVNERIMPGMVLNPRGSDPMEVARLALFLASNDASFVNGTAIVADGGWTAY